LAKLTQPREWFGSDSLPLPSVRPLASMALPQPASLEHPMSQALSQKRADTLPWETRRSTGLLPACPAPCARAQVALEQPPTPPRERSCARLCSECFPPPRSLQPPISWSLHRDLDMCDERVLPLSAQFILTVDQTVTGLAQRIDAFRTQRDETPDKGPLLWAQSHPPSDTF